MPTPDFVAKLRSKIGTDLLWLTGVSAIVLTEFDGAEHVLLGQRSDTGQWAGIYGILEPGEQPAIAAAREVLEETGIEVEITDLVAVVSGTKPTIYPNGDQAQYLDVTFLARPRPGAHHDLRAVARVGDDESLRVGWFPVGKLPQPAASSLTQRLSFALQFRENPHAGPHFERPDS